ncbi:CRISPR system precrRNA processing endoribonuclease RAMP protein Cas6 [bacterium]|nr:CRISPR system precrRNA processing endoribonuclease RAMP protein Cas6 [bacterium]MBU1615859.1 CRISPR system precrRNA processing endoribonuclease RAMP protein Cas6 [bacterium]
MENFALARFDLIITPKETLLLPAYKGSTLRGGFGHAFKRVVCANRVGRCEDCLLKEKCVYAYVFETPVPKDTEVMRKYPSAPHPFVIEPPLDNRREFGKEDELTFGLVLIGRAIDYLPYFIFTFEELGRIGLGRGRGKYFLKEVRDGQGKIIYSGREKTLREDFWIIKPAALEFPSSSSLTLSFLTPTRIKHQERLTKDIRFHILIRTLLRRAFLLSYFHCDKNWKPDFSTLIPASEKVIIEKEDLIWYDWQRYSARQDTRMKLGGFVGEVTYTGEQLKDFSPYILLGKYIHVGKGATFGLGKYEYAAAIER